MDESTSGWHRCSEYRPESGSVRNEVIYMWHETWPPTSIRTTDYQLVRDTPGLAVSGTTFGWWWNYDLEPITAEMRGIYNQLASV